ncbi:GNAT family N-acetyltransferase [Sphingomonas sp.]|uniref:GNAT family N-acetyltransferase n=1 Tax=Sphingomonas sp. TaxID=28214 RepID=UPI0025D986A7|nr:GNAT family N-acetyltransferase [Sphingomonas sp.]MBV9527676.1 GNAT family N-acetyltransferase [Sphingomonas sp.]
MTVSFRPGNPADAQGIADVFRQSFVDTFAHLYRPEDLADFLSTKDPDAFRGDLGNGDFHFIVAETEDEIIGYVKLGPPALPVETPPGTIELCQLYVLKEWIGAGIGRALMDRALGLIRDKQARHVQLSVFVDNHRARRFYERYGFHAVGRYDFMVGSHADEDIILRHIVLQADE